MPLDRCFFSDIQGFKTLLIWPRDVAWRLRAPLILQTTRVQFSAPKWQLTKVYYSNSRGSDSLRSPQAPAHSVLIFTHSVLIFTNTNIHLKQKINSKSSLLSLDWNSNRLLQGPSGWVSTSLSHFLSPTLIQCQAWPLHPPVQVLNQAGPQALHLPT